MMFLILNFFNLKILLATLVVIAYNVIYQLLDEAEHDTKSYANQSGSYLQKTYLAEADSCLQGLHNSSYHAIVSPVTG